MRLFNWSIEKSNDVRSYKIRFPFLKTIILPLLRLLDIN